MECLKISRKCILGLVCLYGSLVLCSWTFVDIFNTSRNAAPAVRHISSQLNQPYPDGSSQWKIEELRTLGKLVQRRLSYLQNPKNCTAARKVLCRFSIYGFGSSLHQLTFCLIVAYATERTLILESKGWKYAKEGWETMFLPLSTNCTSTMNQTVTKIANLRNITHTEVIELPMMLSLSYLPSYLPLAIPEDLAEKLLHVHRNPSIWWVGQIVAYLIRPNRDMQYYLKQSQEKLASRRPIVGIHIRRTDKITEADYHRLEEYMMHVDEWFNLKEKNNVFQSRYVYLATDNPDVVKEARNKYPNYTFFNDINASTSAKRARFTETSLRGILVDVYMLSMCDFVVCTMSSNVCRLVYELIQTQDGEASERLISLDTDYYFNQKWPGETFEQAFKHNGSSGLQMKGLSVANDKRANPSKPIFTFDNERIRVAMPVYPEVKILEPNK